MMIGRISVVGLPWRRSHRAWSIVHGLLVVGSFTAIVLLENVYYNHVPQCVARRKKCEH